jgi:hypothetical protein
MQKGEQNKHIQKYEDWKIWCMFKQIKVERIIVQVGGW